MHVTKLWTVVGSGVVVGGLGLAGVALAGPSATASGTTSYTGCLSGSHLEHVYRGLHSCPSGESRITWNARGPQGLPGAPGAPGSNGKDAIVSVTQAQEASSSQNGVVPVSQIGGKIATGITQLTQKIMVQPGDTYQINMNGVFYRDPAGDSDAAVQGDTNPDTSGTLVIWLDANANGTYDWQTGEGLGTCQTAYIPKPISESAAASGDDIQASCSMTVVVKIPGTASDAAVPLYLGGFGYNSDTSGYGTGPDPAGHPYFGVVPQMSVEQLNAP